MPERIRLSRKRGFRKPSGAVVVARGTRWGNPHRTQDVNPLLRAVACDHPDASGLIPYTRAGVVELYRLDLLRGWLGFTVEDVVDELRGKDLACWCPLDEPCHADVLLEVANAGPEVVVVSHRFGAAS